MKHALVTGVNGFVAGHLVEALRSEGDWRLTGLDVAAPSASRSLDGFVNADISDSAAVLAAIESARPDCIFHLAGVMARDPALLRQVNELGTLHVLDAVRLAAPEAAVLVVGSAAEYGPRAVGAPPIAEDEGCTPREPYGVSKLAATRQAEYFAKEHAVRVVIVRPFNVIGAGMSDALVVGALVKRARAAVRSGSAAVRVGNMDAERDFIDVADVATGCVAALARGESGGIYNLCSGRAVKVRDVAIKVLDRAGGALRLESDPALDRGPDASVGSTRKSANALGFSARIPLEQSLRAISDAALSREERCASAS
jgi:GDP-4-dehydro-6-deoxy-D-mannose reductase